MLAAQTILDELKALGTEKARKTYARHGMPLDKTYGVSIADLKPIAKRLKGSQSIACELYKSGVMEAMYLAGIVADGAKMSGEELDAWAEGSAGLPMIAEYTVPWVSVESPFGSQRALGWLDSKIDQVASSGWCTFSGLAATKPDDQLNLAEFDALLSRVVANIERAENRERYTMNGYVIAVGTHILPLMERAKQAAEQIGAVSVDMGDTACKVPSATDYIAKAEAAGRAGSKRKTIRC